MLDAVIMEWHTAVFFCMRYKATVFEAGGRREKNNLICESLVLYLIGN
jgi:hypothetical protein